MEDKYVVLVKAYTHSSWTNASGLNELDLNAANDLKARLTGGMHAAIAIAKIEEVWVRNPEVGEIHGD